MVIEHVMVDAGLLSANCESNELPVSLSKPIFQLLPASQVIQITEAGRQEI